MSTQSETETDDAEGLGRCVFSAGVDSKLSVCVAPNAPAGRKNLDMGVGGTGNRSGNKGRSIGALAL